MPEFDQVITSYMESGLESFHMSFSAFLSKLRQRVENGENEEEPQPIRLDQLYFFLIVFGIQIIIAVGAFVAEIVVHRRRFRRVHPIFDI